MAGSTRRVHSPTEVVQEVVCCGVSLKTADHSQLRSLAKLAGLTTNHSARFLRDLILECLNCRKEGNAWISEKSWRAMRIPRHLLKYASNERIKTTLVHRGQDSPRLRALAALLPDSNWEAYKRQGWTKLNLQFTSKERRMLRLSRDVFLASMGVDAENEATFGNAKHVAGYDSSFGWVRTCGSFAQLYVTTHPSFYRFQVGLYARLILHHDLVDEQGRIRALPGGPCDNNCYTTAVDAAVRLRLQLYNGKVHLPKTEGNEVRHADLDWRRWLVTPFLTPAPQAVLALSDSHVSRRRNKKNKKRKRNNKKKKKQWEWCKKRKRHRDDSGSGGAVGETQIFDIDFVDMTHNAVLLGLKEDYLVAAWCAGARHLSPSALLKLASELGDKLGLPSHRVFRWFGDKRLQERMQMCSGAEPEKKNKVDNLPPPYRLKQTWQSSNDALKQTDAALGPPTYNSAKSTPPSVSSAFDDPSIRSSPFESGGRVRFGDVLFFGATTAHRFTQMPVEMKQNSESAWESSDCIRTAEYPTLICPALHGEGHQSKQEIIEALLMGHPPARWPHVYTGNKLHVGRDKAGRAGGAAHFVAPFPHLSAPPVTPLARCLVGVDDWDSSNSVAAFLLKEGGLEAEVGRHQAQLLDHLDALSSRLGALASPSRVKQAQLAAVGADEIWGADGSPYVTNRGFFAATTGEESIPKAASAVIAREKEGKRKK